MIREELEYESLLACSDGSCFPPVNTLVMVGYLLVRFTMFSPMGQLQMMDIQLACLPIDWNWVASWPPYTLFIGSINIIISHQEKQIYCNNKSAINKAFTPPQPGIHPFLTPDYDLLGMMRDLVEIIPLIVVGEWVKWHYTGKNRAKKHELNDKTEIVLQKMPVSPTGVQS